MGIQHATDDTFEQLVLKNDKPTVVDFWATWCGPCKMVAPEMEKIAAKYEGAVDVVKVDVDANPRISQAFNIMSIPTIAFFRPGHPPARKPPSRRPRRSGCRPHRSAGSRAALRPRRSGRPASSGPTPARRSRPAGRLEDRGEVGLVVLVVLDRLLGEEPLLVG